MTKCCMCGKEKGDVEPILEETPPICLECFGKSFKYWLKFVQKFEKIKEEKLP